MTTDYKLVICVLGAVLCVVSAINLSMPGWAAGSLLLLMGWLLTASAWFKAKSLSDKRDLWFYAMVVLAVIFSLVTIFITGLTLYAVIFG